ncbi:MAG: LPP20 family lipoprotein, partial [Candidatus Symbiothrix sp.]|nr:LPP20 family lipoprotein [Candidatus Symbiothrix sp.]
MYRYFILLFGCIFIQTAYSQTVDQIKKSPDYYWGEGTGKTTALADKDALSMLIGSISVNIENKFDTRITQTTENGKIKFKEYVNSLVQTHSNATIKNTEILSWGEEPEVHVFRFVKKSEA